MNGTRFGQLVSAAILATVMALCAAGCGDKGGFAPSAGTETLQSDGNSNVSPGSGDWDTRTNPDRP